MMVDLAPGWKVEMDRGPDWLFIQLHGPFGRGADASGMAESIELLMHQDFAHRVVLELQGLTDLPADLVHELFELRKTVSDKTGQVRLCGLTEEMVEVLAESDCTHRFTPYRNREDAVLGIYRPNKPR